MPRRNLSAMPLEALLKLKEDVAAALSRKAESLKQELARLGDHVADTVHTARYGKGSLKARKVAPKYRDRKTGATWAGRGAQPVWLREAIKGGARLEDFLIAKPAAAAHQRRLRKTHRRAK